MIFHDNEVPSGLIDGANRTFLLAAEPSPRSSLLLLVNGVAQTLDLDFTLTGNTIVFTEPPQPGYVIRAWYREEAPPGLGLDSGLYRDDVVQLIMDRLGQRTGLETLIIRHMQAVQAELQSRPTLPWFLVRTFEFTTDSPQQALPLPFLREIDDVNALVRLGERAQPLEKLDYDFLITSPDYAGQGAPTAYAVYGNTIFLFKKPDKPYDFRFLYYSTDAPLSSNVKNRWLTYAADLILAQTGLSVARTLRDYDAAALFEREAVAAWANFVRSDTARRVAGTRSTLGDYSY